MELSVNSFIEKKPAIEQFTHLHLHTIYSVLDGVCKLQPLADRAKELGMKAVAITDHGHTGGCLKFQQIMKENGIKPILGMEAYTTADMKIAALDIQERDSLAIFNILKSNIGVQCNWEISKLKRDVHSFDEYTDMINKALPDGKTYFTCNDEDGMNAVQEVIKKDGISKFKRLNKKVFEQFEYDMHQYHLILLAMNDTGWKNMISLQSLGFSECQYNGRALIDLNLLKKYNEGIIVTTACIGSRFSKLVQQKKLEQAEQELLNFKDVFGDRFYLEIQPLSIPQQIITNAFYFEMHKKHNIPVIATSDTHYINKDDWDDHDTYLCISIKRLKDDEADKEIYRKTHKNDPECKKWKPRMKYTNDFWFRSKEEMIDGFIDQENNSSNIYRSLETDNPLQTEEYRNFWLEALNTTNKVADRINDDILIGSATTLYPVVKNIPEGFTSDTWLFALAMEGLVKYADKMKKAGTPIDFKQYSDKIIDEMAVISTKHYSDYFLGVKEYVEWSNSINNETGFPNCITGPGRGSAAGSLILFLIGITKNIDPIKYNLMFSRFLTMDRDSPPDVDIDFSYAHRPLLIKHLEEVYGKSHVCHIGTWSVESIYIGLKDFARVLNKPISVADNINKELQAICNNDPKASFKFFDAYKETAPDKYKQFLAIENKEPELFRLARKFEGVIRQWGAHASGVIACPKQLLGLMPTRVDKKTGDTVAMFTGEECESINFIKYDVLGLKTLDVIEQTLTSIGKDFNWLYNTVKTDDKKTFDMICRCDTDGVFQIESDMMKGLVKDIQPRNIDDLSAIVALGRPGPMGAGSHKLYAEWRRDQSKREDYMHGISDILDRTFGVICYQEQLNKTLAV